MNATQLRQGDILLVRVEKTPAGMARKVTPSGHVTVGYGEATGHHHTLQHAAWYVAPEVNDEELRHFALGDRPQLPVFVVADEPTTLTHPEHAPLRVEPGVWRVVRQREYTPQAIRSVRD